LRTPLLHPEKNQRPEILALDLELEAGSGLQQHGLIKKRLILSGEEGEREDNSGEDVSLVYILENSSVETESAGSRLPEVNAEGNGRDDRFEQLTWKQASFPPVTEAYPILREADNEVKTFWKRPEEVTGTAWRMEAPAAAARVAAWPSSGHDWTVGAVELGEQPEDWTFSRRPKTDLAEAGRSDRTAADVPKADLTVAGRSDRTAADVPKADLTVEDRPKADWTVVDGPKADWTVVDVPKAGWTMLDGPKADWTVMNGAKGDWTVVDGPKADRSVVDVPKVDRTVMDGPKADWTVVDEQRPLTVKPRGPVQGFFNRDRLHQFPFFTK